MRVKQNRITTTTKGAWLAETIAGTNEDRIPGGQALLAQTS
jgi:hypothetical protein